MIAAILPALLAATLVQAEPAPDAAVVWRREMQVAIQRGMRRPEAVLRAGRERCAVVRFTVDRAGNVAGIRVARRSGSAAWDAAALAGVRQAAPFDRPPEDAFRSERVVVVAPVAFRTGPGSRSPCRG